MKKQFQIFFYLWLAIVSSLNAANKTSVNTSTFVSAFSAALDGDTLLLDAGTYASAISFPTAKSIVLKMNPTATTLPEITFQIGEPTGAGGSLTLDGLSINRNGDYLFSTSTTYNMGAWKFLNCTIKNINKSLMNTTTTGGTITSITIDNCVISNIGTASTNFIVLYHVLGSLTMRNSTINNFKGGNWYNAKHSATGNVFALNYSNNTIYKSIANSGWAMCSIEGGGYASTSSYLFANNILDGAAGSVSPRLFYTKTGGVITQSNNLIIGYQSDYIQGTNTTTRTNLTLGTAPLAAVLAIPYKDATTGDFSIPETSPIATAGVNGVCLGDPRWITKVTVPATISTSIFPVGAGIVSPTSLQVNQNDSVSLTATPNFGYHFANWTNANGVVVSSRPNFKYKMTGDVTLTANFTVVNTYALNLSVAGGANDYMVSISPSGVMVNGVRKYEEGTTVTLTSSNNKISTFNNWSTGETTPSKVVTMTQDQTISAVYSTVDYIVGWDFYKTGGSSRIADFRSSSENEAVALILRKADGTANSWLDKSILAAGGYYGQGAAVNWKQSSDMYYYQTSFNATNFKDIVISADMLYNYCAYSTQKLEYSLDGTNFSTLGTYNFTSAQSWINKTVSIPSNADHATVVYVRWIPDYTSSFLGTPGSDGTSLSNIFITANIEVPFDSVAPALSSSVPAVGSTNASTTGNIILNFDKKLSSVSSNVITGVINGKQFSATIIGKTLKIAYTGLQYNTQYTFTLPANSLANISGVVLASDLTITFTTMTRPIVSKKLFDFVVGVDGDFKAALNAATAASSNGQRFRIFFPNGQYNIGANTGDANQMTTISLPNVSYVGQSAEDVVLYNKNTAEGMNVSATLNFTNAANDLYLQDISIKNGDYRSGVASIGRCLALYDSGSKNIFKNVNVLSNQDTYFSASGRKYFEGGSIHGTVDYIFGGGDVFFNNCLLYMEGSGYISAPNTTTNTTWGYVFNNCTIDGVAGVSGNYRLGRPWQNSPKAVYLNTIMNVVPAAEGWSDWYTAPAVFAEYNSLTTSGTTVDLTARRMLYGATTVNPVLTAEQAATYTVDNVLGGNDAWQPTLYTDQANIPSVSINGSSLNWANNDYVLCWAIFKDDVFVTFTTSNNYSIPLSVVSGKYSVRAANEMGGLSAVSNVISYNALATGINDFMTTKTIVEKTYYTLSGIKLMDFDNYIGVAILKIYYSDGSVISTKVVKTKKN